jgi:hypothetical protein
MGCDYYIHTELRIEYANCNVTFVLLHRDRGYFTDYDIDSDEEDYEDQVYRREEEELAEVRPPIRIFENGAYLRDKHRTKYHALLVEHSRTSTDIVRVTKIERRIRCK